MVVLPAAQNPQQSRLINSLFVSMLWFRQRLWKSFRRDTVTTTKKGILILIYFVWVVSSSTTTHLFSRSPVLRFPSHTPFCVKINHSLFDGSFIQGCQIQEAFQKACMFMIQAPNLRRESRKFVVRREVPQNRGEIHWKVLKSFAAHLHSRSAKRGSWGIHE